MSSEASMNSNSVAGSSEGVTRLPRAWNPETVQKTWVGRRIQQLHDEGKKVYLRYGLSANPIHLGHPAYLQEVADALNPDKVIVTPAKANPLKEGIKQGTAEQKERITEVAVKQHFERMGKPVGWQIDKQELFRTGDSFTWVTLRDIESEVKKENAETFFLITDESAEEFHMWYNPLFIVEHCTLIYGNRPGKNFDKEKFINTLRAIDGYAEHLGLKEEMTNSELKALRDNKTIMDLSCQVENKNGEMEEVVIEARKIRRINPKVIEALENGYIPVAGTIEISSTTLRNKLANDEAVDHFVGPDVAQLIKQYELYKKAT